MVDRKQRESRSHILTWIIWDTWFFNIASVTHCYLWYTNGLAGTRFIPFIMMMWLWRIPHQHCQNVIQKGAVCVQKNNIIDQHTNATKFSTYTLSSVSGWRFSSLSKNDRSNGSWGCPDSVCGIIIDMYIYIQYACDNSMAWLTRALESIYAYIEQLNLHCCSTETCSASNVDDLY